MMNCDIIRDLLPLYADDLASEESSRQIKEHTAHCPACKKLLHEMTAPLEPEPADEEQRAMEILQKHYKKQRRKTILTWAAALLAVVLVIWGMMEVRYSGELLYAASTSEEKILKQMPELKLTEAELALAQTILEYPAVQEAQESGEESVTLDTGRMLEELTPILPEDGELIEVFIHGSHIYITIMEENRYTSLAYSDIDQTGHIDMIVKTMAVYPRDVRANYPNLGEPDALYEVIDTVGANMPQYRIYQTRHMWFSFLNWFE